MSERSNDLAVAQAIRRVTAKMQEVIESGRRSAKVDAYDLVEVLLAIADELDPDADGSIRSGSQIESRREPSTPEVA